MFGDRGGERGHNRARFLMLTQFERDGRADNGLLPFKRNGQAAHPMPPFADGQIEHFLDCGGDIALKTFIGAKEEMQRTFEPEHLLVLDPPDRRRGGKAQRHMAEHIADMVRAARALHLSPGPIARRTQAYADARAARHGAYDPGIGHRPVNSPMPMKTGAEIGHHDGIARIILIAGFQHGGVAQIALRDLGAAIQINGPKAMPIRRMVDAIVEQRAEGGRAIDAGQAPPQESAVAIDQRRDLAITDGPEVKRRTHAAGLASQASTAAGPASLYCALVARAGPTRTERPPSALTAEKADSSVRSSPR